MYDIPASNGEDGLLSVSFVGSSLLSSPAPIYDVSVCFNAIQRIINKAYLSRQGRLFDNSKLTIRERQQVSLCIVRRRTGSDIYDLISFLSDPLVIYLVIDFMVTLGYYAFQKVASYDQQFTPTEQLGFFPGERFDFYIKGIKFVTQAIDKQNPLYLKILTLEQRLLENIDETRRFGDEEARRARRSEIIDGLNSLTLHLFDESFLNMCQLATQAQDADNLTTREDILASAIYNDVSSITRRINKTGVIQSIEFSMSKVPGLVTIRLDHETKRFVDSLKDRSYLGEKQRISGTVKEISFESNVVDLIVGNRKVRVLLNEELINKTVRFLPETRSISIDGRPRLLLGSDNSYFHEFIGEDVLRV